MNGEGMGTLSVYTQPYRDFSQAVQHWTLTGNSGPFWRRGRVTIPPQQNNFQVSFTEFYIFRTILV